MAAVSQGSRAALVTWTAITSILFVTATVMAIYFYVDADGVRKKAAAQAAQYSEVMPLEMFRSGEIDKLRSARDNPPAGITWDRGKGLLGVALRQRDRLAELISGSDDDIAAANAAAAAIDKAKAAGATPAGDSLAAAVDALITELNARKTEAENNKKDSEDSKLKLAQTIAATEAQINSLTQAMEQIRQEKDQALQQLQQIAQQQSQGFQDTAEDLRKRLQAAHDQINRVNSLNAELGAQVKRLEAELDKTRQKLNDIRVDPTKAIVRQPDGQIVRVPGGGWCFIDLGRGDQVTPGLTFEVYDKIEGIPPPGDPTTDQDLPVGKASIEVVRVGSTTSQCRIVRLTPGQTLSEGDLIVNLVYDKNTKYNFLVYGNFDIDQNGVATAQEAEIIKRLITQWGGNVVREMNVDTDFVVLGREPVIPEVPRLDEPIAKAKYDAAVAEAEAYADISAKARAYRIPILNQNRFLYLIGYYELAKR